MDLDKTARIHDIGWQWFQVHANQRMQIVSFWFVAMSFLSTGNVLAYINKSYIASLVVGLSIAATSVIFLLLDVRTRELIGYGERLMAATESDLLKLSNVSEVAMVATMHTSNRKSVSYRLLFTTLYLTATGLGLFSVVTSALAAGRHH